MYSPFLQHFAKCDPSLHNVVTKMTNDRTFMQVTGDDLISPDSGFISRGANSIPLDSQIVQSEYDGLDV